MTTGQGIPPNVLGRRSGLTVLLGEVHSRKVLVQDMIDQNLVGNRHASDVGSHLVSHHFQGFEERPRVALEVARVWPGFIYKGSRRVAYRPKCPIHVVALIDFWKFSRHELTNLNGRPTAILRVLATMDEEEDPSVLQIHEYPPCNLSVGLLVLPLR